MRQQDVSGKFIELEQFKKSYQAFNRRIEQSHVENGWCTSNQVVFRTGPVEVREFAASHASHAIPVLIVYSHVNRPNVIDIDTGHSIVRRLCETGNRVFLVDWLRPKEADRSNDLSEYVIDAIGNALEFISQTTGFQQINLVGICQGGTFALCYACLRPQRVRKLGLMVTPVDFHAGNSLLRHWSRHIHFDPLVEKPVNIPGALITLMFRFVRPFDDLQRHIRHINQSGQDPDCEFSIRMDQWLYDCPDQPGRAFAQFMSALYGHNRLVEGTFGLQGEIVNLSSLRIPLLNIFAVKDHLVPQAQSEALSAYVDPECYSELRYCGGHIGLLVSTKAQHTIHHQLGRWLASAVQS